MEQVVATQSNSRALTAIAALVAPLWIRLRRNAHGPVAYLRDCLEQELDERAGFAWFAVAFAAGALVYFELPGEPALPPLLAIATSFCALAAFCYRRGFPWRALTIAALVLAGLTCAKWRVERLAGPQIERSFTAEISGRVLDGDRRAERRPRIVLDRLVASSIEPAHLPERVRLTISPKQELPPLGARVSLKVRLTPVAGPAIPGGYDPRRAAFFEGIGGSGFVLGRWTLEQPRENAPTAFVIERVRAHIVARILAVQPGEAGAVAAALLVGERSVLSGKTNESLRASGLAHILSISGLHMMLISGTAFFLMRALLALSPHLALAYPIRKWAALAALLVVTAYFALSGGGAATVRSYVMAAIMFTAILLDRPAISMRNLALAAFIVLALEPESVSEPGFQMSFAAVAGLIASWEAWRSRQRLRIADESVMPGSWLLRAGVGAIGAVLLTSLVAGLATAPFSAYHFERVATYSLLGNLFAAPLVSAVIMPFGLLTLVVLPFGLEALPLSVMVGGIDMLLHISDWVASLPGAEISAPPISPLSLLLITGGMLWLCLWRLRWRLLGMGSILLGVLLIPLLAAPADMLIAADGKSVAVRDPSGTLRISGGRAGSYIVEQFLAEEAEPERDAASLRSGIACDSAACLLPGRGELVVSHVLDPAAFAEDCQRADIVVTPLLAPTDCAAGLVVDRRALDRFGAQSITWAGIKPSTTFAVETERKAWPRPWQAGGERQSTSSTSASSR
jgi:competence protein ComEC